MRGLGVGKAAQNDHPGAFRTHIAIRRRVKHLAATTGRQHASAGKADEGVRREQQIDAAHHGGFQGWILCQGPCREMQRDKRRRTSGINRLRAAAQIKHMADAVGQDGKRIAGHQEAISCSRVLQPYLRKIGGRPTDKDRDVSPGEAFGAQPRILKGIARHFQQKPLLRVGFRNLARGKAEGFGVKASDVPNRAGGEAVAATGFAQARMVPTRFFEPVIRHFGDGVPTLAQQCREAGQVRRTGQPSGRADNGDGFGARYPLAPSAALHVCLTNPARKA